MVRRLKEAALKDLPPKTRQVVPVEMAPEFVREYKKVEKDLESWLAGALENAVIAEMVKEGIDPRDASDEMKTRLMGRVAKSLRAEALVRINALRRLLGRAKVDAAVEMIDNYVESETPVVVFADTKAVIEGIEEELSRLGIKFVTVDGETLPKKREQAKQDFQAGKVDVFIGSQSAKEGITLTRASDELFVERWWTPGDEEQAEDRIHRFGQKNAAVIRYLQVPGTLDDWMANLVESKRGLIRRVVGGTVVPQTDAEREAVAGEVVEGVMGMFARAAGMGKGGKRLSNPMGWWK